MLALSEEYVQNNIASIESRGVKVICSSCGGKNCWITFDNARGFCFNCGETFILSDVPRVYVEQVEYDIPILRRYYKSLTEFYQNCLTIDHREYLKRRGIDSPEEYGFGYCPNGASALYSSQIAKDAGVVNYDGQPSLGDRIVFPYIVDDEITDIRGRAFGDIKPKYKSLRHSSKSRGAVYPFNYTRAMKKSKDILIITEGEIKAVVADIHGFACVALPGMLSWRSGLVLRSDITPVIVFDNSSNREDRTRVDRAIDSIAKRLLNAHVAMLPLLGEEKMDVDSYLLHKRGGANRFKHIIENAVSYKDYRKLRRF